MAKQNLESLSTDELKKKKKFASLLLGILAAVLLANVIVAILTGRFDLVTVAAALIAVALPMFIGVKRINEELDRREDS